MFRQTEELRQVNVFLYHYTSAKFIEFNRN